MALDRQTGFCDVEPMGGEPQSTSQDNWAGSYPERSSGALRGGSRAVDEIGAAADGRGCL